MKRLGTFATTAVSLLILGLALPAGEAVGQEKVKVSKKQLVGTWAYTSVQLERADGSKVEPWGPNPNGTLIFTANGRYALQLARTDLRKFASKDRMKGTPEENQAVVHGSIAYFGTYTVNEADGSYTLKVEGSSYPNDYGNNLNRTVTFLSANELKTTNPTPTTGAKAYAVFKRVK